MVWQRKSLFYFIILLLLSVILIGYKFNEIPKNLSVDEVKFAILALSLDGQRYTPYSLIAEGHSTLYFYIILIFFKIFGLSTFVLRLPSALFGVGSVLFSFLIYRKIFSNNKFWILPTAFVLAVIFASLRWQLNFARFAFEAPLLLFLELGSVFFMLRSVEKKNPFDFIMAGIFAGLAFNSYQPGRIFFVVPLIYLVIKKVNFRHIIMFLISFVLLIIPLVSYLSPDFSKDSRINQQFFLKNTELSLSKKVTFLSENITKNVGMFFVKGDGNGRHNFPNKPALNPILGILFLLGVFLSIKNFRYNYNLLFITFFLVGFIPSLLTYPWENPNMLRTVTVIPSVIYFVGLSIVAVKKKLLIYILFLLLLFSTVYELRTYFVYQAKVFDHAFIMPRSLRDEMSSMIKSQPNWFPGLNIYRQQNQIPYCLPKGKVVSYNPNKFITSSAEL